METNNKNPKPAYAYLIGGIAGVVLGIVIVIFLWKPQFICKDDATVIPDNNRHALLSLADMALNKDSNDSSEIVSLVLSDKAFYMAFYFSELGDKYFYSRHGSCCPCSSSGRGCCACLGGSAFGAPESDFLLAENSEVSTSVYRLASYSVQQQQDTTRHPLKLDKNTIAKMDIFSVPANTAPGNYFVTFKGKIDLVLDIDVREDGGFDSAISGSQKK